MRTFAWWSGAALLAVLVLPAAAFAQAAITEVVRDASGAVLPGVTVEGRGTRHGPWSEIMKPIVSQTSVQDLMALSAYAALLPSPAAGARGTR